MIAESQYLAPDAKLPYCRGCGHAPVVRQLSRALARLQLPPRSVALTTDIGCVGLADSLFPFLHTVHTTHGRSTAFATGMALAEVVLEPSGLKPVVMIGDGGAMIGLLHLVHAAQLNVDVTVLLHNNFLFGMTGGQHSALTPLSFTTATTPGGNWPPLSTSSPCSVPPTPDFSPGSSPPTRRSTPSSPRRSPIPASLWLRFWNFAPPTARAGTSSPGARSKRLWHARAIRSGAWTLKQRGRRCANSTVASARRAPRGRQHPRPANRPLSQPWPRKCAWSWRGAPGSACNPRPRCFAAPCSPPGGELDFPLVDFHSHIEGNFTVEEAVRLAAKRGVKLGIVEHGGFGEAIGSDSDLKRHIQRLSALPVYKGIQAEGHNWMNCFSKEAVCELDYVLADALTFPEKDGRHVQLWTPEARIEDKQDFMEQYVDFNVQVISKEPIDIFANPTFLPEALANEYDMLWTNERMRKVIDAAVKYDAAIEGV